MIRLPCFQHRWHDVTEVDAILIVAGLQADVADMRMDPGSVLRYEPHEEAQAYPCPLDVLGWAADVEHYYEHCQQAVEMTGAAVRDEEEGGWKRLSWTERDKRRNGTDPEPEEGEEQQEESARPCSACGMSDAECQEALLVSAGNRPCCPPCASHVMHESV